MSARTVTVKLAPEDYAASERHVSAALKREVRGQWPIRVVSGLSAMLLVLGFIGLVTFEVRGNRDATMAVRHSGLLLLAALALGLVVEWLTRRAVTATLYAPGSRLLEPYTLSIAEDGVQIEGAGGFTRMPWSAFLRIELYGSYLFLFPQPNHVICVPERALGARTEFEAFAASVVGLWTRQTGLAAAGRTPLAAGR